ncbi:site-specific integrase [Larkinella sp. C7]|uniref:site-specific integrase n=1 Tax=Larkinella sp. C7 TaxID=2576607 RepID=UPI0011111389|nr:site-specific integrase [Larkinella sp. C7]
MLDQSTYRKTQEAVERGQTFKAPTCHVSFFIRKATGIISLRVVVNGKRATDKSTGIKATAATFDPQTRTLLNDPTNTARLRTLESNIQRIFKDRELSDRSLDPTIIRDIALGLRGHDEQTPTVVEAIALYSQWHEQRFNTKEVSNGTIKRYRTYHSVLERFFTLYPNYGKNFKFSQLTPALQYHLVDGYLKSEKKYCHNYALKIFQFFRGILEYAIAHEWADRNPIRHVRIRKYYKDPVTLTMAELEKLKTYQFVEAKANEVRDVFLFCCYTGLAYVDVAELSTKDLATVNGVQSILKKRHKSGQQAFIPLFPDARVILDRYQQNEMCCMRNVLLPVMSNQKMNKWLKIIGNIAGIKESLHTHLARKTFTMYSEELGFTLDEMAVMMGHANPTMTRKHYHAKRATPVVRRFQTLFQDATLSSN